jgi:translocator protein
VTPQGARKWRPILIAGFSTSVVAGIGTTLTAIGPWYRELIKPSWTPPDIAFGAIWTVVFSLIAVAGYKAWAAALTRSERATVISVFALNGFLNVMWSLLFFDLQRPDWAIVEVVAFWISIVVMIGVARRHSRAAGWLLAPYLLWVSVAAFLNWEIIRLNGAFG